MANKVVIDIEARFADQVSGKTKSASNALNDIEKNAKEAVTEIDNLSKKKATPKLDADNSRLLNKTNVSTSKLTKLGNTTATAKIKASDEASSKVDKVISKVKSIANKTYSFLVKTKDSNALQSLTNISNAGKKIAGKTWSAVVKVKDLATAPLTSIKNMLTSIQTIVLAIGAGIATNKLFTEPISVADTYTSSQIGFSTLLGESQGQSMMDQLDDFAKSTPFSTSSVIENAQKMMAMGWDSETLIEDMDTIGDAAAATGKLDTGLESIVRAMSQIQTKGRLSTEELNQLAEAGINAKEILAEELGYGTGDEGIAAMTEDLEDGAIASGEAIEALLSGMQKYDGMMESIANETVEGLSSQLQDAYEISVKRSWGQGLQEGMKDALSSVVDLVDESEEALEALGDTVYEIGYNISSWVADKVENAIQRITEITGSYEFQNADLGEKISMLWDGVIVNPLKEWWEGGGQQATAETAGEIGAWMGEAITDGLLTLFGVTDILDDETAQQLGEEGGMTIAQSFVNGFKESFDGSAITDAFVDAISDIWDALPTWAQAIVGGYGVTKVGSWASSAAGTLVSGIENVKNVVGSFDIVDYYTGSSGGSGLMGMLGSAGAGLGATTSMGAVLTGTAGVAGGIAGAASLVKGGVDLYKGYHTDDAVESQALKASGNTAIAGTLGGAAVGFAVGGPVGALIGAGVGGIAGWIGGEAWADDIRAAKYEAAGLAEEFKNAESEEEQLAVHSKALWENASEHFGDIELSLSEIERLADQIVWSDDIAQFEQLSQAIQATENSLQQFNTAAETVNRWTWKASLGVTFNDDEKESIIAAFDDYVESAKNVVENKHYEFTAAVGLLLDVESEIGSSIISSGNDYYTGLEAELDTLQTELQDALSKVLADNVISSEDKVKVKINGVEVELNEQDAIAQIQEKIAEIEEKVASAQAEAELETLKIKFSSGDLDYSSFTGLTEQISSTLEERLAASETALTASIASLKLQLDDGAITQEEYDAQLKALADGYTATVDSIKAEVMDVELQIVADAYEDILGEDGKAKLTTALQSAIEKGISSEELMTMDITSLVNFELTPEELEANSFSVENIQSILSGVLGQMEAVQVDTDLLLSVGATTVSGVSSDDLTTAVQSNVPETVQAETSLVVKSEVITDPVEFLAEEFGIEPETAVTTILKVNAASKICDKVEILKEDFGIDPEYAWDLLLKLTGNTSYSDIDDPTLSSWGLQDSYTYTIKLNINASTSYSGFSLPSLESDGEGYRGGIFGGESAMDAFARGGETDNSGIVGGSTRFIRVNEESPEMIIPLSSQRRDRALKLWSKTGDMLGVPGFARGGSSDGSIDEGIRFGNYGGGETSSGQNVEVDVGGITVEINVSTTNSENIAEAIRAQANEIAETVAGIMADAIGGQYENTPLRGGIA